MTTDTLAAIPLSEVERQFKEAMADSGYARLSSWAARWGAPLIALVRASPSTDQTTAENAAPQYGKVGSIEPVWVTFLQVGETNPTLAPEGQGAAESWPDEAAVERATLVMWGSHADENLKGVTRKALLAAAAPTEDAIGCAEREVGRWVYRRIETLMRAKHDTPEGRELAYLATVVNDVEEYGATGDEAAVPSPSKPEGETE